MKRIVKLSACFAALAVAYAAALSRDELQGRDRLIVALVRESLEWNIGREKAKRKRQGSKQDFKSIDLVSNDLLSERFRRLSTPALSPSRLPRSHRQRRDPKQTLSTKPKIKQLPLIALLCFGLYALSTLLLGVATFRDVPEANASLQKDIAEARGDLARRGVVDVVASD